MSLPILVTMYQNFSAGNRPTAFTWSGTTTYGTHSNDTNAYDLDTTPLPSTSGNVTAVARPRSNPGFSTSIITYDTFGSGTVSGTLKVYISTTTEFNTSSDLLNDANSDVVLEYATDWNGSTGTWNILASADSGSDLDYATPQTGVLSSVNRATLAVRVTCTGLGVGTTIPSYAGATASADIYDIIIT